MEINALPNGVERINVIRAWDLPVTRPLLYHLAILLHNDVQNAHVLYSH